MVTLILLVAALAAEPQPQVVFGSESESSRLVTISDLAGIAPGSSVDHIRVEGFVRGDWEGIALYPTRETCTSAQSQIAIGIHLKGSGIKPEILAQPKCGGLVLEGRYKTLPAPTRDPPSINIGHSGAVEALTYVARQ